MNERPWKLTLETLYPSEGASIKTRLQVFYKIAEGEWNALVREDLGLHKLADGDQENGKVK